MYRSAAPLLALSLASALALPAAVAAANGPTMPPPRHRPRDPKQHLERTSFQNASPWDPMIQLRSDVAMAYGIDPSLPERIA